MKPIKLNLGQLSFIYSDLLGNQNLGTKGIMTLEMKVSLKFKLHTLAKAIEPHFQFVQEENKKLLAEYGEITPGSAKFEEFVQKMNEIMAIEHEISVPELKIEDFESLNISEYPANLFNLLES
jgi:hypothetical protein